MESEQGVFTELGYIAYRGKLTLDELMMGDPVGAEPEYQPHLRKNRQRGGER